MVIIHKNGKAADLEYSSFMKIKKTGNYPKDIILLDENGLE